VDRPPSRNQRARQTFYTSVTVACSPSLPRGRRPVSCRRGAAARRDPTAMTSSSAWKPPPPPAGSPSTSPSPPSPGAFGRSAAWKSAAGSSGELDGLRFNPWNTGGGLEPAGWLNEPPTARTSSRRARGGAPAAAAPPSRTRPTVGSSASRTPRAAPPDRLQARDIHPPRTRTRPRGRAQVQHAPSHQRRYPSPRRLKTFVPHRVQKSSSEQWEPGRTSARSPERLLKARSRGR
jgi:hypothetical protein